MSKTERLKGLGREEKGTGWKPREKMAHGIRPGKKAVLNKVYSAKSDGPAKGFGGAVGVTRTTEDSGKSHGQGGNMGECVQIGSTVRVTNP